MKCMSEGSPLAAKKAGQKRVFNAVFSAPEHSAGRVSSRLAIGPYTAAGDGRTERQRDGGLARS